MTFAFWLWPKRQMPSALLKYAGLRRVFTSTFLRVCLYASMDGAQIACVVVARTRRACATARVLRARVCMPCCACRTQSVSCLMGESLRKHLRASACIRHARVQTHACARACARASAARACARARVYMHVAASTSETKESAPSDRKTSSNPPRLSSTVARRGPSSEAAPNAVKRKE
eukprot:353320-Pleurochrysis_carterae.AAC.1